VTEYTRDEVTIPRHEAYLPAVHVHHLAEVTTRYGVSLAELIEGLGLEGRDLNHPDERISIAMAEQVAVRAVTLTGEPALGWLVGLQMRISAYGYLGFAAMVASTAGDAIELVTRFTPTRTNAISVRLDRDGDRAAIYIEEMAALGEAREMIVIALMESTRQIGGALVGQKIHGRFELAMPEPPYFARLNRNGEFPDVYFGCVANRLVFDASVLDLKPVLADPAALRLAIENCERELTLVREARHVSARVRAVLGRQDGLHCNLERVAEVLGSTARTVRRRLVEEGTTFSELLDDARRAEGLRLVASSPMSLEAIATRLGYASLTSFHRAYKRWTGHAPSASRHAK
jgi:AraC-like DNA-binding protein